MTSFAQIIDLWGPPRSLAGDIGALANTVSKWRQRDFIPPEWWVRVAAAAGRRGFDGVSVEQMARISEARSVA
jgi:hypothetical protein